MEENKNQGQPMEGQPIREEEQTQEQEAQVKGRFDTVKATVTKLRNVVLMLAFVVLIWGLYVGISEVLDKSVNVYTEDAQVEQYLTPVHIRAMGYVQKVNFTEHQHVRKGDTLLILDQREYLIQLKQARANLRDAQANGNVLGATIERTQQSSTVYDNSINELEIRLAQLERDKQRYENLVVRKAATQYQLDQIVVQWKAAKENLESVRRQRAAAKTSVSEASRRQESIAAALERAEAALEQAELNLSYTVVTAPCDGKVGRRAIEEGQFISTGTVVTNIIPDKPKWVIANYKERQVGHLEVGTKVEIEIDAIPDRKFQGHVSQISGATGSKLSAVPTDNSAGNFVKIQQRVPVRIEFDGLSQDDFDQMAAGMMVQVRAD